MYIYKNCSVFLHNSKNLFLKNVLKYKRPWIVKNRPGTNNNVKYITILDFKLDYKTRVSWY